ncbi:uncharacterized protein I206_103147 [Kwoniella pini CBS 10737]|uniref:BTB domain-containing protein n=1 Tax=Kwoniella pini CBS 10737 TaxID=1296096 RepID=A0A1B9IAV6_9TREE|nr:uncharacterized protein I206_01849 [Kwoniella pini CBS 10737]OCF52557.1 hypothetical protein I206_01849 [Kwoniella pini CBS 10737]
MGVTMKVKSIRPTHNKKPSQEAISSRKLSTISENTVTSLNQPFQDDTADLVLISSDGLIFKVHHTKLNGCRIEFRNALFNNCLSTPPPSPVSTTTTTITTTTINLDLPEIHFLDPTIESSIILSLFLRLLYNLSLPIPNLPIYFQAYENLVKFIKRWECNFVCNDLSRSIRSWLEEGNISSSKVFKIGDSLNDIDLMRDALKKGGEYTWSGRLIEDPSKRKGRQMSRTSSFTNNQNSLSSLNASARAKPLQESISFDILRDGLPDQPSLDLTAVPYEYFISLSDEVKFALLRASRVGRDPNLDTDWEDVSVEFNHVLRDLRQAL